MAQAGPSYASLLAASAAHNMATSFTSGSPITLSPSPPALLNTWPAIRPGTAFPPSTVSRSASPWSHEQPQSPSRQAAWVGPDASSRIGQSDPPAPLARPPRPTPAPATGSYQEMLVQLRHQTLHQLHLPLKDRRHQLPAPSALSSDQQQQQLPPASRYQLAHQVVPALASPRQPVEQVEALHAQQQQQQRPWGSEPSSQLAAQMPPQHQLSSACEPAAEVPGGQPPPQQQQKQEKQLQLQWTSQPCQRQAPLPLTAGQPAETGQARPGTQPDTGGSYYRYQAHRLSQLGPGATSAHGFAAGGPVANSSNFPLTPHHHKYHQQYYQPQAESVVAYIRPISLTTGASTTPMTAAGAASGVGAATLGAIPAAASAAAATTTTRASTTAALLQPDPDASVAGLPLAFPHQLGPAGGATYHHHAGTATASPFHQSLSQPQPQTRPLPPHLRSEVGSVPDLAPAAMPPEPQARCDRALLAQLPPLHTLPTPNQLAAGLAGLAQRLDLAVHSLSALSALSCLSSLATPQPRALEPEVAAAPQPSVWRAGGWKERRQRHQAIEQHLDARWAQEDEEEEADGAAAGGGRGPRMAVAAAGAGRGGGATVPALLVQTWPAAGRAAAATTVHASGGGCSGMTSHDRPPPPPSASPPRSVPPSSAHPLRQPQLATAEGPAPTPRRAVLPGPPPLPPPAAAAASSPGGAVVLSGAALHQLVADTAGASASAALELYHHRHVTQLQQQLRYHNHQPCQPPHPPQFKQSNDTQGSMEATLTFARQAAPRPPPGAVSVAVPGVTVRGEVEEYGRGRGDGGGGGGDCAWATAVGSQPGGAGRTAPAAAILGKRRDGASRMEVAAAALLLDLDGGRHEVAAAGLEVEAPASAATSGGDMSTPRRPAPRSARPSGATSTPAGAAGAAQNRTDGGVASLGVISGDRNGGSGGGSSDEGSSSSDRSTRSDSGGRGGDGVGGSSGTRSGDNSGGSVSGDGSGVGRDKCRRAPRRSGDGAHQVVSSVAPAPSARGAVLTDQLPRYSRTTTKSSSSNRSSSHGAAATTAPCDEEKGTGEREDADAVVGVEDRVGLLDANSDTEGGELGLVEEVARRQAAELQATAPAAAVAAVVSTAEPLHAAAAERYYDGQSGSGSGRSYPGSELAAGVQKGLGRDIKSSSGEVETDRSAWGLAATASNDAGDMAVIVQAVATDDPSNGGDDSSSLSVAVSGGSGGGRGQDDAVQSPQEELHLQHQQEEQEGEEEDEESSAEFGAVGTAGTADGPPPDNRRAVAAGGGGGSVAPESSDRSLSLSISFGHLVAPDAPPPRRGGNMSHQASGSDEGGGSGGAIGAGGGAGVVGRPPLAPYIVSRIGAATA